MNNIKNLIILSGICIVIFLFVGPSNLYALGKKESSSNTIEKKQEPKDQSNDQNKNAGEKKQEGEEAPSIPPNAPSIQPNLGLPSQNNPINSNVIEQNNHYVVETIINFDLNQIKAIQGIEYINSFTTTHNTLYIQIKALSQSALGQIKQLKGVLMIQQDALRQLY